MTGKTYLSGEASNAVTSPLDFFHNQYSVRARNGNSDESHRLFFQSGTLIFDIFVTQKVIKY
jgi:hypothetical protein